MIYDRYRHRASHGTVSPMEVPPVIQLGELRLMVGTLAQRIAKRELEAAERRSRPPQSWSEEQEWRASEGVVEKSEREALAERINARERRQRPPQVEEVPPPGPALAAAIIRAGQKARGEST